MLVTEGRVAARGPTYLEVLLGVYTTTDTLPQTQNTDSKRTYDDDDKAESGMGYADEVEKFEASCWF